MALTEETKTKISQALKGRTLTKEHRAKISANLQTRRAVQEYRVAKAFTQAKASIDALKALEKDGITYFWVDGTPCPRCGCSLVSDGAKAWCSFVGGAGEAPCTYGIDTPVPLESLEKVQ